MKRVILESPFGENPALYIPYARACLHDSVHRGEAPLASHLLYTQPGVLRDEIATERELGMSAGFAWYVAAEAIVVYRDYGISRGMQQGIDIGMRLGLPIEYRGCPLGPNYGPIADPFPAIIQVDFPRRLRNVLDD